jgi:uncharacterized membrane protein
MKNKDLNRVVILILSALGIALSAFLTYLHYSVADAAFCVSGSGCATVRESSYSAVFGIPVALFGVIGYSLIFILSLVSVSSRAKWLSLYFVSLAGVAFSAYLTYLEFFVIKAICPFCVISAFLITGIFITLLLRKPKLSPGISFSKLVTLSGVVVAVVVFSSILLQSDVPRGDVGSSVVQTNIAKHLGRVGATMYGSYRCPHCIHQKELFGEAFKHVRYVECHPNGENANPSLCLAKGVRAYPTWEIDGKFYVGTKSIQELAKLSGYERQNGD